jgi:hypothetical protein
VTLEKILYTTAGHDGSCLRVRRSVLSTSAAAAALGLMLFAIASDAQTVRGAEAPGRAGERSAENGWSVNEAMELTRPRQDQIPSTH